MLKNEEPPRGYNFLRFFWVSLRNQIFVKPI